MLNDAEIERPVSVPLVSISHSGHQTIRAQLRVSVMWPEWRIKCGRCCGETSSCIHLVTTDSKSKWVILRKEFWETMFAEVYLPQNICSWSELAGNVRMFAVAHVARFRLLDNLATRIDLMVFATARLWSRKFSRQAFCSLLHLFALAKVSTRRGSPDLVCLLRLQMQWANDSWTCLIEEHFQNVLLLFMKQNYEALRPSICSLSLIILHTLSQWWLRPHTGSHLQEI